MKVTELTKILTYEEVIKSLVLIILYGVALRVTINGTKFRLIMLLIAMMMLSELGTICFWLSRARLMKWTEDKSSVHFKLQQWIHTLGCLLQDLDFNVVYFVFANEYYKMSVLIPSVIKEEAKPRAKAIFSTCMLALNMLVPVVEAYFVFMSWQTFDTLPNQKIKYALNHW